MTGEISIGGVFVPTLLLLFVAALMVSALVTRLLGRSGFYRFVAYRALVDLALFILVFGGLSCLATYTGFHL
ncbi:MAG: DUF1656 domain-containing protein [Sphingomonadales bacterium]|nr:MAG: DUF1656 domain-containing protein [Sphingomonadales bacterium]TNF03355.1 MAG: DUF1656 domain-containing protein [Sphingomonadales bacterium]